MREFNSRFLRLRSRNPEHARYQVQDRAEDYTPEHGTAFDTLACGCPIDEIDMDLCAHADDGGQS